jgi:excinuclease ABC subunit C
MICISLYRAVSLSNNSIMQNPTLALQIQTLPDSPGVYQYMIKTVKSCMWGKLRIWKRVSSYFNKIHDTAKTNVLVKRL